MGKLLIALGLLGTLPFTAPVVAQGAGELTVLTVGGGPEPRMNQVAIESNVRYVDSLLPKNAKKRILFADGTTETAHVLYIQPEPAPNTAEEAYRILMEGSRSGSQRFRRPELRSVDGSADLTSLRQEIGKIAEEAKGPILLYFTGHGEKGRTLNNNFYSLWAGEQPQVPTLARPDDTPPRPRPLLTVRDLAAEIKRLPASSPVTVIMVQCYSGSFANLLFEDGDPEKPLLERPICGFFAATPDRPAAGCTPEINEADYQDFTSYFFAALSGKDRSGKPVQAVDYDKNGTIGMEEAYIYAVINEPSIDVPVVTSDQFLRRFVSLRDDEVAAMPYSRVLAKASPARKAALEALSKELGLTSEDRLKAALDDYRSRISGEDERFGRTTSEREATSFLISQRNTLLDRFPELAKAEKYEDYLKIRPKMVSSLAEEPVKIKEILEKGLLVEGAEKRKYTDELRGARYLRLFRIAKSVVLEDKLRSSGDSTRIAQLEKLRTLEAKNPLR
jgi:hypothetical protein